MAGTGLDVQVTGGAAIDIDITDYLAKRMLVFFGAVLALSFVLLMIVFRSLLVPLKAVLMNVLIDRRRLRHRRRRLPVGMGRRAARHRRRAHQPVHPDDALRRRVRPLDGLRGLLLSRIREEYLRTGDATTSVADGVASTARVITAAAAIMVVVFASFMLEDIREIKMFGLGLAVAVLARRHARPHGGRPGHHGAPRRPQLVDPEVARPDPAAPGDRAHPAVRSRRG